MLAEIVELGTKLTGGVFIAEVDARFELVPWLLIKALNIEYDGVTDGVVMEELVDGIARYNKKRRGGLPGGFPRRASAGHSFVITARGRTLAVWHLLTAIRWRPAFA